jgi:hypothetical protein
MSIENFMGWQNPGVALITGSSSGIGAEFARQLAEQGFDLVLIARREQKLKSIVLDLQKQYSINCEILIADLANLSDNDRVIEKIVTLENLDVLINNAGFGIMKPFLEIKRQWHIDMINVHFTSPVILTHAAIPIMKKRKRGVIINTSSRDAIIRNPSLLMYTTTKTATSVFSELIKRTLKGTGIYIQALHPGFTETEFHDTSTMSGFNRESTPEEMWMTPQEVVSLSLNAVKTNEVIFIPGEKVKQAAIKSRKMKIKKYSNCEII